MAVELPMEADFVRRYVLDGSISEMSAAVVQVTQPRGPGPASGAGSPSGPLTASVVGSGPAQAVVTVVPDACSVDPCRHGGSNH